MNCTCCDYFFFWKTMIIIFFGKQWLLTSCHLSRYPFSFSNTQLLRRSKPRQHRHQWLHQWFESIAVCPNPRRPLSLERAVLPRDPEVSIIFCFSNTFALFKAHLDSLNDWIECPIFSGDFFFPLLFFFLPTTWKTYNETNNQHTHVTTPSHQAGKATSGDPTQPNFGQYAIDKNAAMATKLSNEDFDIVVRVDGSCCTGEIFLDFRGDLVLVLGLTRWRSNVFYLFFPVLFRARSSVHRSTPCDPHPSPAVSVFVCVVHVSVLFIDLFSMYGETVRWDWDPFFFIFFRVLFFFSSFLLSYFPLLPLLPLRFFSSFLLFLFSSFLLFLSSSSFQKVHPCRSTTSLAWRRPRLEHGTNWVRKSTSLRRLTHPCVSIAARVTRECLFCFVFFLWFDQYYFRPILKYI